MMTLNFDFLMFIFNILTVLSLFGTFVPFLYMFEEWKMISKNEIIKLLIISFVSSLLLIISLVTNIHMHDLREKVLFYEKNISVEESYDFHKMKIKHQGEQDEIESN